MSDDVSIKYSDPSELKAKLQDFVFMVRWVQGNRIIEQAKTEDPSEPIGYVDVSQLHEADYFFGQPSRRPVEVINQLLEWKVFLVLDYKPLLPNCYWVDRWWF